MKSITARVFANKRNKQLSIILSKKKLKKLKCLKGLSDDPKGIKFTLEDIW
jgi:hypothetical protein